MRLPDVAGVLDPPSDLDRAIAAWRGSGGAPVRRGSCTVLKESRKSRVYRLVLDDRAGTAIVAKRRVHAALETDLVVYGVLADQIGVRLPALHAVVDDPPHRWAFMEDVSGAMYDPGRREHREALADWLAAVHTIDVPGFGVLPPHLSDRYLGHLRSTASLLDDGCRNPAVDDQGRAMLGEVASFLGGLEEQWSTFAAFDDVAPRGVVHGDLAAKNVFVHERPRPSRRAARRLGDRRLGNPRRRPGQLGHRTDHAQSLARPLLPSCRGPASAVTRCTPSPVSESSSERSLRWSGQPRGCRPSGRANG